MSFGFSVGVFLTIFEQANKLRKRFINAPAQFDALSEQVRNLSIVVHDEDLALTNAVLDIPLKNDIRTIATSCGTVLAEVERALERYTDIDTGHGVKKAWKRLRWDQDEVRDLQDRVCYNINLLKGINGRVTRDKVVELLEHQKDEQHQVCLDWLSSTGYAEVQSEYASQRQPGTGEWLLESSIFQDWVSKPSATLFCPGIPGAGKSILASVIVEELKARYENDHTVGVAYFFCSFQTHDDQSQKIGSMLACLLRQLSQGLPEVPESIKALCQKHKSRGSRPSLDEYFQSFRDTLNQCSRAFIVVDALDECQSSTVSRLLDFILELQASNSLNFLATSRFIPETTARFKNKPTCEIRAAVSDVMEYLWGNLSILPSFVSRDPQLQEDIVHKITDAADGMFLLARLMLESLQYKSSPRKIRQELNSLTSVATHYDIAYDTAYDKAMERIQGQVRDQRKLAEEVLSWITCARRPLTALELRNALAVELGESEFYDDNVPDLEDIISACAGLVTTVSRSSGDVIRLVHATAKEYFERNWTTWFPDAHSRIATTCVTYLSFDVFEEGICPDQTSFEERIHKFPLYAYASLNWGHHAHSQPIDESLMLRFLSDTLKVDACVQGLFYIGGYFAHSGYNRNGPPGFTGLHLAAYFGLLSVVSRLIKNPGLASTKDSMGRVPLAWAAYNGHTEVIDFFMNHGSSANIKDKTGRTPISLAASMGHLDALNCFLEHKIDPDTRDIDNRTPLSWAAYRGHLEIVKAVLEKGADPDARDEYSRTPLLWASYEGWVEVVELLRERDVDIETRDRLGRTALSWASENGHLVVVRLLLEKGARLDSMDGEGRTPLSWAIRNQQEAIQLLLQTAERSRDEASRSLDHVAELQSTSNPILPKSPGYLNSFATEKDQMSISKPLENIHGTSDDGRVYFIPTTPNATTTLTTLTERLRASFTDEDLIPIGRWFLDHKLMRDTPGLLPQSTTPGQPSTKPRYMQLLSLSHYPTHGFIYTSEPTEKPFHPPSAASPTGSATPVASAASPGASTADMPMVMTTVPPPAYKTLFQHFTYACQPFWCLRLTVTVPNGVVYDVGDFRVRMGDVRQTFPAARARGSIVEIEWRGPSVVDSLARMQQAGTDGSEDVDSGVDMSICALEEADIDAEYMATASLIREFWSRLGVSGAKEAILLPGIGKEVKEKLGKAKKEQRNGEIKAREEIGLLVGAGSVPFEDDVDPSAGTDTARQFMEVLRFNR
ncbi:Ankyrin repeat domain-containing protein 50 [Penicillium rolfsii]|nr:Ankyrin repeat domain-containing protein 50 [Penicillium rolfsii]